MQKVIYLDYNATTPVDQKVLELMLPYFNTLYGNPSGNSHSQSWMTAGAVKIARKQVSELIKSDPSEIIFTSGASESINLAVKGVLLKNKMTKFITSNIEHAAGMEVAKWAQSNDYQVHFFESKPNGLIDLKDLEDQLINEKKINPDTTLFVSLILAHNEIGSLYSLEALSELKTKHNFILHLDATQALLTENIDVYKHHIDLLSLSAHKIYGPKGAGALFLNKKTIGHQIEPLILGGGQEFGLRSGTLNVPGIVGLGAACELVNSRKAEDLKHFMDLNNFFRNQLSKINLEVQFNGDKSSRIFQNISITLPIMFQNVELMTLFNGFCISQGSACASGKTAVNHTLKSLGLTEAEMQRTLRIGLGRSTTHKDLELFVDRLASVV